MAALGVGVPGRVDPETGHVTLAVNLDWHDLPLGPRLEAQLGIPTPCMSSALSFYDGYRRDRLPANLLQAQRDYFGAHTYERTDKPRGEFFHTNWTGRGGNVSSRTYNA